VPPTGGTSIDDRSPPLPDDVILRDTIRHLKGLERPVIVLVDLRVVIGSAGVLARLR